MLTARKVGGAVKKIMTLTKFILERMSVCEVMNDSRDPRIDKCEVYQTVPQNQVYERNIGITTNQLPCFHNSKPIKIQKSVRYNNDNDAELLTQTSQSRRPMLLSRSTTSMREIRKQHSTYFPQV